MSLKTFAGSRKSAQTISMLVLLSGLVALLHGCGDSDEVKQKAVTVANESVVPVEDVASPVQQGALAEAEYAPISSQPQPLSRYEPSDQYEAAFPAAPDLSGNPWALNADQYRRQDTNASSPGMADYPSTRQSQSFPISQYRPLNDRGQYGENNNYSYQSGWHPVPYPPMPRLTSPYPYAGSYTGPRYSGYPAYGAGYPANSPLSGGSNYPPFGGYNTGNGIPFNGFPSTGWNQFPGSW